jgi:hypothetical protein
MKIGFTGLPSVFNLQIATIRPTQSLQFFKERRNACLSFRIVFSQRHEHADPSNSSILLCPSHKRAASLLLPG